MAIEKDIAIHSSAGLQSCVEYITNHEKCTYYTDTDKNIDSVLKYTQNEEKTTEKDSETILTSGIMCDPGYASAQFAITRDKYDQIHPVGSRRGSGGTKTVYDPKSGEKRQVHKETVEAYHIIQSFPAVDDLDPKLVHEIGKEYAQTAFAGHQCVVSTHMNTGHIHNHIVVCAYKADGSGKFLMNKNARHRIRQINDELSVKHHLPILIGNERRYAENRTVREVFVIKNKTSFKQEIREDINKALSRDFVRSWDDYIAYMKSLGYTLRETPENVTYIKTYKDADGNDKTHRCRDCRLGDSYLRSTICEEKGWQLPSRMPRTNYMRYLDNCYSYHASSRDKIIKDERTYRLYLHVDRYDEDGRRRTLLEITIIAAIKIIHYFWDKHRIKGDPTNDEPNKPVNWDYDRKLNAMLEGLELARTLKIEDRQELKEKMFENGKRLAVLGKELSSLEVAVTKATVEYDSLDKASLTPEELAKYDKNFHDLSAKYASMKQELNNLQYEYSLMSKLKRAVYLAKDPKFALGPDTHISNYPSGSVIEGPDTKPDRVHNGPDQTERGLMH